MIRCALESDVLLLIVRSASTGDPNRAPTVHTTQTSFCGRWAGRPERSRPSWRTSARSSSLRQKEGSATGRFFADRPGHPEGTAGAARRQRGACLTVTSQRLRLSLPLRPRRQTHLADRHLLCEAERNGCVGAARRHHLAALHGQGPDDLLRRRSACCESARKRRDMDASAHPKQLAFLGEARERLIHRGAASEVQERLGRHRPALGQGPGIRQDGAGDRAQGCAVEVRMVFQFPTYAVATAERGGVRLTDGEAR